MTAGWLPYRTSAISIHAPVKGATQYKRDSAEWMKISIHAPVKGATLSASGAVSQANISIHAPVKGATRIRAGYIQASAFQSTLP